MRAQAEGRDPRPPITPRAVTDRDEERVADEVEDFAPSIASTIPNEPCFAVEKRL